MEVYDSEAEDGPIALGHVQQQPVRLLAGQDVCEAQDVAGLRPRQARQHARLAPEGPHLPAQPCAQPAVSPGCMLPDTSSASSPAPGGSPECSAPTSLARTPEHMPEAAAVDLASRIARQLRPYCRGK